MSTLLLPLNPAGEGTLHVEAFASYFARLAYTHHCSLAQLARLLSSTHSAQTGRKFTLCESVLYAHRGAGLFGYRETVDAYVSLVEVAVGSQTLRRCTLIPLRAALANQCMDSVRSHRAWCEQCYREDLGTSEGPYDRLLWTLKAIERCPEHRVALRTTCPACASIQRFFHRSGSPVVCWKCGRSMVGSASLLRPQLEPTLGERDLCEIVKAIAAGQITDVEPIAMNKFEDCLHAILSPIASVVSGVAAISGRAKARGSTVKPSLKTMLRRAHAAGVPLLHVLEDPKGAALSAGQLIFDRSMIAAPVRIRHPKQVVKEVQDALRTQLRLPRTQQIPPLWQVAEVCGVSEGFVRHHCPGLVKRYQSHRMAASVLKTVAARRRCVETLTSAEFQEKTRQLRKNVKRLAVQLSVDAKCGVRMARSVLRKFLKS